MTKKDEKIDIHDFAIIEARTPKGEWHELDGNPKIGLYGVCMIPYTPQPVGDGIIAEDIDDCADISAMKPLQNYLKEKKKLEGLLTNITNSTTQ